MAIACTTGCGKRALAIQDSPRPVALFTLKETQANRKQLVTGSVDFWKTEALGFEVSGRLNYVIEAGER